MKIRFAASVLVMSLVASFPNTALGEERRSASANLQVQVVVIPTVTGTGVVQPSIAPTMGQTISYSLRSEKNDSRTFAARELTLTDNEGEAQRKAVLETVTVVAE